MNFIKYIAILALITLAGSISKAMAQDTMSLQQSLATCTVTAARLSVIETNYELKNTYATTTKEMTEAITRIQVESTPANESEATIQSFIDQGYVLAFNTANNSPRLKALSKSVLEKLYYSEKQQYGMTCSALATKTTEAVATYHKQHNL